MWVFYDYFIIKILLELIQSVLFYDVLPNHLKISSIYLQLSFSTLMIFFIKSSFKKK